jgi:hypothetical protein
MASNIEACVVMSAIFLARAYFSCSGEADVLARKHI